MNPLDEVVAYFSKFEQYILQIGSTVVGWCIGALIWEMSGIFSYMLRALSFRAALNISNFTW